MGSCELLEFPCPLQVALTLHCRASMSIPARTEAAPSLAARAAARADRWFVWVGLLALVAYGIMIAVKGTIAAGGSDGSGYLNSARLLASGQLTSAVRSPAGVGSTEELPPVLFQPLGFVTSEEHHRLKPNYPTGFPLHVALASTMVGWSLGPRLVEVAAALAAVLLCYGVGRQLGLTRALAATAAVVLAACPVMIFVSLQPLSDLLATTWSLAAFWAGLQTRRHVGWAALCGAGLGVAVLVRPTNVLLAPALLLQLGFDWRRLGLAAGLVCAVASSLPCRSACSVGK